MFLLNMAFISSSEVENIYIIIYIFFTSRMILKPYSTKNIGICFLLSIQAFQPKGTFRRLRA